VRIQTTFTYEMDWHGRPDDPDEDGQSLGERIEFWANESSSCADNLVDALVLYVRQLDAAGGCMCALADTKFIETVGPVKEE